MNTPTLRLIMMLTVAAAIVWPSCASARSSLTDLDADLKGPKGGGVSVTTVKQNAENMTASVDRAQILESNGDRTNTTYNPDGTIQSVNFSDGTNAEYSYLKDAGENINTCSVNTKNFALNFISDKNGRIKSASMKSGERANKESEVIVFFEPSGVAPTMHDISHKPIPYELVSGINKALDDLAKTKAAALEDYKLSSAEYYDKVEGALKGARNTLTAQGIDVDILLKDVREGLPEEARRRAIDEAVGYIRAVAAKDKTGNTAREFIDSEQRARDIILVSALKDYNSKIKEAVEYINKIIDSLMKSKLAVFMAADKDKIDAIINLPEIKKVVSENTESRKK